jgi:AcrR family transcriptional regulator
MSEVKRPYRSRRRKEQAEETRRRILTAARRGFVEHGYGGTTMESIAAAAGVAVQTIYASLGSKQGLLMALLDDMAAEADLPGMLAAVEAAKGDPRKQLRERLAFTCRLYARGADLIDIARTVSGVEPDLRAFWLEGEARRHRGTGTLVAQWGAAGALAPGVTAKHATDVMWALGGPDVFRLFVVERGWSQSRFERWLAATLELALFGSSATP